MNESGNKPEHIAAPAKKSGKLHYAWIILFGLFLYMGFTRGGMNNSISLFIQPISTGLSLPTASVYVMFSISSLISMFWSPIAGKLIGKYDIRLTAALALLIHGASFALLGISNSLIPLYVFMGVMTLGTQITTQLLGPTLVNAWFVKKRGFATGLMMAVVSLIGALLQPVVGNVIVNNGWRMGFFSLGIAAIVVGLPIAIFVFKKTPKDKGLLPYGVEEGVSADAKKDSASAGAIKGISCKRALKSGAFWFSFAYLFFLICASSISTQVSSMAAESNLTNASGLAMSFYLIGTTIGAIGLGSLVDKIGPKISAYISLIGGVAAVVLLLLFRQNLVLFYVAFGLLGFSASGIGTLSPLLLASIFGYKEFSQIFGYLLIAMSLGSTIISPIYGIIYDSTKSYNLVLLVAVVLFALAVVAVTFATTKGKKLKSEWK